MNRKQKIALWLGLAVFVCMGLIPPWVKYIDGQGAHFERAAGYYSLFVPPVANRGAVCFRLDVTRLLIQWTLVALVTGALVVSLKGKTSNPQGSQPATVSEASQSGTTVPYGTTGESAWLKPGSEALRADLPKQQPPPFSSAEESASATLEPAAGQPDTISELLRLKRDTEAAEMAAPEPTAAQPDAISELLRLKRDSESVQVQLAKTEPPTAWLSFWTYFRLPVGGLVAVVRAFQYIEAQAPIAAMVWGVASVAVGLCAVSVAWDLHKRRLGAWKANWFFVFGEPVLWVLGALVRQPTAAEATVAEVIGGYIGRLLFLVLIWGFWSWPNYIYFMKRRSLFK